MNDSLNPSSSDPLPHTAAKFTEAPLSYLLSPKGIRGQAQRIYQLAQHGGTHFSLHEDKLVDVSNFVLDVIVQNYPDKNVPYHSRWRHFEVGDQSQLRQFQTHSDRLDPLERARIGLDLIIPSVLVDAGAGPDWRYPNHDGTFVGRSEGLALASLDLFMSGSLAHNGQKLTSAKGLQALTPARFCNYFKVNPSNPLLGVEGRVALLKCLGKAIEEQPAVFPNQRPGDLAEYILNNLGQRPKAEDVLQLVLTLFGSIWPGRLKLDGVDLGDTWIYKPLGNNASDYIPFHKLSQWLSYSIIETLDHNGFNVVDVNQLTGLAEYRNGGLILDTNVIQLREPEHALQTWPADSELIIEWRALTICLLDKIAQNIVDALGTTPENFPLAKVLEGGTWAAGRKIAQQKRGDLSPPLRVDSDATVF